MSREISEDSQKLLEFLKSFDLSEQVGNQEFVDKLRSLHRKTYGYLLFITELKQQKNAGLTLQYFEEAGSDLLQSIFSWSIGSYKSANLMLRSSIETFLKALLGEDDLSIYEEKSMYKLFDKARESDYFKEDVGKRFFEDIHSKYKELCSVAHSSPNVELGTISSLKWLPQYNKINSNQYHSISLKLIEIYSGILLLNFHSYYINMHKLNLDVFLSTLSLSMKREIFLYHEGKNSI